MCLRLSWVLIIVGSLFVPTTLPDLAEAREGFWQGDISTDWNTAGNWFVVGALGDAAAGLRPNPSPVATRAQRRPTPLVREGQVAAAQASAAIDVSDGFLQDLRHLCKESGVGSVVECSALPLGKAARALPDGMELALGGGEDYALLLSVPRRKLTALSKKLRFAEVGRIVRGRGIQLTELGRPRPLPRRVGFDHLK